MEWAVFRVLGGGLSSHLFTQQPGGHGDRDDDKKERKEQNFV